MPKNTCKTNTLTIREFSLQTVPLSLEIAGDITALDLCSNDLRSLGEALADYTSLKLLSKCLDERHNLFDIFSTEKFEIVRSRKQQTING